MVPIQKLLLRTDLWQEELFCIADHSAASQFFGDRISAPCPRHVVAPRTAQKRPPGCQTGCIFNRNPASKFGSVCLQYSSTVHPAPGVCVYTRTAMQYKRAHTAVFTHGTHTQLRERFFTTYLISEINTFVSDRSRYDETKSLFSTSPPSPLDLNLPELEWEYQYAMEY